MPTPRRGSTPRSTREQSEERERSHETNKQTGSQVRSITRGKHKKGQEEVKQEDTFETATITPVKRRKTDQPSSGNRTDNSSRKRTAATIQKEAVKFPTPLKRKPKTSKKEQQEKQSTKSEREGKVQTEVTEVTRAKKRKTKEEKEAEAMPLSARTNGLSMFLGAHVSSAKGVQNSVTNALHIGANAFAMFLKSQRKWENPPLQDEHRDHFKTNCQEHRYDAANLVLPHGSYLVNLAQADEEKHNQGYEAFLDDLRRCEALNIGLYNFHPGWTGSATRRSSIGRIASALNRAHAVTHKVVPVLETMAGSGSVIGSMFEDLRDIINLVEDKTRVGVCIDTCHVFAAGYDLRGHDAFRATLDKFDSIVGIKYLRALHLNDSKAPFASRRDLHQNIGLGFLGLRAFHNVMNERRFENLPLVLETPIDHKDENGKVVEDKGVWAREIKLLESLIGMDPGSSEFKALEDELALKGAEERNKYAEAFEKKKAIERKKAEKGQIKLGFGQKPEETDSDDDKT